MIERYVFVKLKDRSMREAIAAEARRALAAVPVVQGVQVGLPADEAAEVWDLVLAVRFRRYDDVAIYVDDPIHVAFVQRHLAPNVQVKKVWNFRIG